MDWQENSDNYETLEELKSRKYLTLKDDFDGTIISPLSLADFKANKTLCGDYVKTMENSLQFYKSLNQETDSWLSPQESREALKEVAQELKKANSEVDEEKKCIEKLAEIATDEYELLQGKLESATQMMQLLKEKREKLEKLKQERQASFAEIGAGLTKSGDFIQLQQQQEKRLTDAKSKLRKCQTSTEEMKEEIIHLKQQHQYLQQKNILQQKLRRKKNCKKQLAVSRLQENIERLKSFLDVYKKKGNLRLNSRSGNLINMELCNQAEDQDVPQLIVSTTMEEDNLGHTCATEAQVSDQNVHADDLLTRAVYHDDLPQLFSILQTRWKTFFPFASEMKNLADRHAVDWIQNKNLVRILVGKRASIMCTLHVPETYPFSGEITLVEASGLPDTVTENEIQPPPEKRGLQGWLDYLEDLFGKP